MSQTGAETTLRDPKQVIADQSKRRASRLIWRRFLLPGILVLVILPAGIWGLYQWRESARQLLVKQCQQLQAEKNWNELRKSADQLARIEPASAEPWIYKAAACEETKDFEGMIAAIDRVGETNPRFGELHVRKLLAEFRELNRPLDGLKTCDRILEVNPLVMKAHEESINFCVLTLQRAEMVRRIRRAIICRRERPEDYVFLATASWFVHSGVFSANSSWLKSNPVEVFAVAQAVPVYLSHGKTGENAEKFADVPPVEQLFNRYPENLELLNYLIQNYIDFGNMKAAETLLDRVPKTKDAENDARLWRARSVCQDAKGDLPAAAESLQQSLRCDPYWWKVHYELHQIYHRMGQQELADRLHAIYEAGRPAAESISMINYYLGFEGKTKEFTLSNKKLLAPILKVALMVEDWDVAHALQDRIALEARQ